MSNQDLSSGSALMDLRLAILMVIAKVWKKDAEEMAEAGTVTNTSNSFRAQIKAKSFSELDQFFQEHVNYEIPFENFGVKFIEATAEWNLYGDYQWTKPEDETITITLPLLDSDVDMNDKAEKLMEYYSYYPSFLGRIKIKKSIDELGNDRLDGNNNDLGVSDDSFLSFGAVTSKIIAAVWDNKDLLKQLDYDARLNEESVPRNDVRAIKEFNVKYFKEIKDMLVRYYHFEFPWSFNLKFVVPAQDESFWINEEDHENYGEWRLKAKDGSQLIRNWVTLEIPNSPSNFGTNDAALALARYNLIGPAYPFTCS